MPEAAGTMTPTPPPGSHERPLARRARQGRRFRGSRRQPGTFENGKRQGRLAGGRPMPPPLGIPLNDGRKLHYRSIATPKGKECTMGLFSSLFGEREILPYKREVREKLLNSEVWGNTFMEIGDIYEGFSNDALGYDDQIALFPQNPDLAELPQRFEHVSWHIEDFGRWVPAIAFDPQGDGIIRYGEFMDALRQKGEEYGWDYLYRLKFGFYLPRTDTMWGSYPYFPTIEKNAYGDPRFFIITGDSWYNEGNFARGGIGGFAGL